MAGHSKWSQIKHKKAKEDAKRGKAFTKLLKEISIAARLGGGDPTGNPRLRTLLEKAKEINMPIENSQRAIKRGIGELPGSSYEDFMYEGYGPGGIAILIDALSDNKNRTVAELRHLFTSKGGNLAESGAVSWMFHKMGVIRVTNCNISDDELIGLLLTYNVHDITPEDGTQVITCDARQIDLIKGILEQQGYHIENADLEWIPNSSIDIQDAQAEKAVELLTQLQDHEDVKNVYTNMA